MSDLKQMRLEDEPNDAELILAAPAERQQAVALLKAIDFHRLDCEQASQAVLDKTQPAASAAAFYYDED